MEILVLGAGVIGLTTAYYLSAAGHVVTVVDRRDRVALESSHANGGQLSYSYVAPLAGPGVLGKVPGWLLQADAPMRFRPTFSLDQWRWCLQFAQACTRGRSDQSTRQLLGLSMLSRTLMHRMVREETALSFDYMQSGKLVVHRDAAAFQAAVAQLELQRSLGCEQQALDAGACVAMEPALAPVAAQLAGGIYTASEDSADCYRFCTGLEQLLRGRGVGFALNTPIDALRRGTSGRVQAFSGTRVLGGQRIVVALGSASAALLKPLGIRLPIYPLKGYSLTLPLAADAVAPTVSVTDFARKIVYARLGERLRVAGMADLGAGSPVLERRRLATLRTQAAEMFAQAGDYRLSEPWAGLRPATPRGTPLLGATAFADLWLNVGHGALGFTLAAGSGQLLSDWMSGRPGAIGQNLFRLPH